MKPFFANLALNGGFFCLMAVNEKGKNLIVVTRLSKQTKSTNTYLLTDATVKVKCNVMLSST